MGLELTADGKNMMVILTEDEFEETKVCPGMHILDAEREVSKAPDMSKSAKGNKYRKDKYERGIDDDDELAVEQQKAIRTLSCF